MNCVVCGTESERCSVKWSKLNILECHSCRHIFWNGTLGEENLLKLYSIDYFKGEEYSDYEKDKHLIQKNFSGNAATIRKYKSNGKLLELGSAFGYFLDLMRKDFTVKGYEICQEAVDFAREKLELDVVRGNFLDEPVDQKFDVACLWDVIEHLERPDLLIEKLSRQLNPGGYLFLTTGDISALIPRLRGVKWRLVHPPTHVHYFGRGSLCQLLTKHGFEIIKVEYPGVWRSFHQLFASVFGIRDAKRLIPGAFYLNLFDIMRVIARKPLSTSEQNQLSRPADSHARVAEPTAEAGLL